SGRYRTGNNAVRSVHRTALFRSLFDGEFFDVILARFAHGFFDVGVGEPGGGKTEQCAGERAQEGRAFTIWDEGIQPFPFELTEELREAVQADGTHADNQPEHPMQGFEAAPRRTENDTKPQKREIDGDVAFAQRHFVAHDLVADVVAGFKAGHAVWVAQVGDSGNFLVSLVACHARFRQRIKRLFAKKEEGAKTELMTERFVDAVDEARRGFRADLHQG